MMKVSIFLFTVVLIGGLVLTDAKNSASNSVQWDDFGPKDLEKLHLDEDALFLVHFRNKSCGSTCDEDASFLSFNEKKYKQKAPALEIKTVTMTPKVAKELRVVDSSSIFLFTVGHTIRIDHNMNSTLYKPPMDDAIMLGLTREPVKLETVEQAQETIAKHKIIPVVYGKPKSKFWVEARVTAKMSQSIIYFTESKDVANVLGFSKPEKGYLAYENKNRTYMMPKEPYVANLAWFVEIATEQYPMEFDEAKFRETVEKGIPIFLFRSYNQQDKETLSKLVLEHDDLIRSHFKVFHLSDHKDELQNKLANKCTDPTTKFGYLACILEGDEKKGLRFIYRYNHLGDKAFIKFLVGYFDGFEKPFLTTEQIKDKFRGNVKNLNTKTLEKFLEIVKADTSYRVVHYYNRKTPESQFEVLDEVAHLIDNKKVNFGRINLDENEPITMADPGLYFTGLWDDPSLVPFKGKWESEAVRTWIDSLTQQEDAKFAEALGGDTDL